MYPKTNTMNRICRAFSLLLLSIIFVNCQKELNYIGDPDTTPIVPEVVVPEPITANLQGNVFDENNQPAAGVTITVGTKTTITTSTGYFRINDASLDKRTSLVVAQKTGYFKGLRVFSATSGANQIVIKLVKRTLAGTVSSATGGSAILPNGAIVALPANGIVTASTGAAFVGTVNVYAAYIDPSASDIATRVPGSFAGTDKNGGRVLLTSYGMMGVELESTSGEKLQVKTGSVATLTTPIPNAAQSTAPSTISLWSVDEQTGLWVEDGTATKQGNTYVGDVKHFSFWNCDVSSQSIRISMTLHNGDSLPLVHVTVRITRSGTGWQSVGYGYTDSLGHVGGVVPPNETLLIEVLDPCNNVVYSQTVAPLTTTTDLGTIIIPNSTTSLLTLSGMLQNCTGSPVANGFAVITFNSIVRYAATDALGHFECTFITCAGTPTIAQIIGIDQAGQQQSAVTTVTITAPATNAGTLTACGTSSVQFINYTLDGVNYSLTSTANDSLTAYFNTQGGSTSSGINIMANQNPTVGDDNIYFTIPSATTTGTFPLGTLTVQRLSATLVAPFNSTLTGFATAVGDFYEGSFSGQFTDSSVSHNISTNFRVRKSF